MQMTTNRQREKNGAERLLGNPSLREHLDDDQAERLLRWGFNQIEAFVLTLESIPDEDADPAIEKFIDRIILLMRCLNRLTFQLDHEVRDDSSQAAAADFLQASAQFKTQSEQAVLLLQTAVNFPADWSAKSAFDFLFTFLESQQDA